MGLCDQCKKQSSVTRSNSSTNWKWLCDKCYRWDSVEFKVPILKEEIRASHWNDIRSRVTTHEGEFLHGKAGREYQRKWSRQYLGRDLGNISSVDRQQVEKFIKTKR